MIKAIIPECFVDTCLINIFLGTGKESVNHGKGNSTVANKMRTTFGDNFAVGIIDKDKRQIEYLNEFELHNDTIGDKLLLFRHRNKNHYIIQLCPESEDWICNVSNELNIRMTEDYGLPNVAKDLAKLSKDISVSNDLRFVRLFKEIKRKSFENNYVPVVKLISWLEELRDNSHNVDLNKLAS